MKSQSQLSGTIVHIVAERFYAECPHLADTRKAAQIAWLQGVKDEEFVKEFGQDALDAIQLFQEEYTEATEATLEFGRSIGKNYKAPTWTGYWQREYAARFDALEAEIFAPIMKGLKHVRFQSTLLDIYQHISRCTDNLLALYRRELRGYAQSYVELKLDPRIDIHGALKGGRIDLIGVTAEGDYHVWDFKTGRKDWDRVSVYNEPQLNWYVYGTEQQFKVLPVKKGILDLYNGKTISVPVVEADITAFKKQLKGSIRYEQRLHKSIEEGGIDKTLEQFPLPIGRLNIGCPCNLAYEEDTDIKCKAYKAD